MRDYWRLIDTNTPGPRYDVTPLFADCEAFSALIDDLCVPFSPEDIDCVAGIDALGFVLATALALRLGRGLVLVRKGGKLPVPADRVYFEDYDGERKSLELRTGAVQPGARVLLVDEWIETGAQVRAALQLLEGQGASVVGIATIIMDGNAETRQLAGVYHCHAVWDGA